MMNLSIIIFFLRNIVWYYAKILTTKKKKKKKIMMNEITFNMSLEMATGLFEHSSAKLCLIFFIRFNYLSRL